MKTFKNIVLLTLATVFILQFTACKSGGGSGGTDLAKIDQNLKKKFGEDAYYTTISIAHDKSVGNIINTTVTDDPASLKMGEYTKMRGVWEQKADVTLELGGGEAKDYMFNLTEDVDLAKLGELVKSAKEKLATEKDIQDAHLKLVTLNTPSRGTKEDVKQMIILEPKNGGTSFTFTYTLDGELENFDY